jgi:hypothetical protein
MVGKGSPSLNVIGRISPKLSRFLPTTSAIKKKSECSLEVIVLFVLFIASVCIIVFKATQGDIPLFTF